MGTVDERYSLPMSVFDCTPDVRRDAAAYVTRRLGDDASIVLQALGLADYESQQQVKRSPIGRVVKRDRS
jgi:hypothetical protein